MKSSLWGAVILMSLACIFRQSFASPAPTPTPWPHQFHSRLWVNNTGGSLSQIDLWYDWPNGRNFNIIRDQLDAADDTTYDLEWNNGTSFVYTPGGYCRTVAVGVGILRPDWLVDDSTYLGQHRVDGFLCNVWTKAEFIWYYEDVATKRPVYWQFYTGRTIHVMTFEVGAVLEDAEWQAPLYCFDKKNVGTKLSSILDVDLWERHRHLSAF